MPKKIIKKKQKPSYNLTEMQNIQLELFRTKQQKKMLIEREEELKKRLDDFMTNTIKPDSKGHYLFTVLDENGEKIHLQKQSRRKINLNKEKAITYLRSKGLSHLVYEKTIIPEDVAQDQIIEVLEQSAGHLLDTIEVVDEGMLEQLVLEQEIPMKEFEELCEVKQTYAMAYIKDADLEKNEE